MLCRTTRAVVTFRTLSLPLGAELYFLEGEYGSPTVEWDTGPLARANICCPVEAVVRLLSVRGVVWRLRCEREGRGALFTASVSNASFA